MHACDLLMPIVTAGCPHYRPVLLNRPPMAVSSFMTSMGDKVGHLKYASLLFMMTMITWPTCGRCYLTKLISSIFHSSLVL